MTSSQWIAGMHGGVEHAGGSPALAGAPVVGDEQPPHRPLRRRAELGPPRPRTAAPSPAMVSWSHSGLPPAGSRRRRTPPCARPRPVLARRDRRQRHAVDPQHAADALHQHAVDQRPALLKATVEPAVIGQAPGCPRWYRPASVDQSRDAQQSAHRATRRCPREEHIAHVGEMRPQLWCVPLQHGAHVVIPHPCEAGRRIDLGVKSVVKKRSLLRRRDAIRMKMRNAVSEKPNRAAPSRMQADQEIDLLD